MPIRESSILSYVYIPFNLYLFSIEPENDPGKGWTVPSDFEHQPVV